MRVSYLITCLLNIVEKQHGTCSHGPGVSRGTAIKEYEYNLLGVTPNMRKSTSVALLSLCLVFLSTTTTNAISPIVSTANTANPVEVLEYFYNADVNVLDIEIDATVSVVDTEEVTVQEPAETPVEETIEEEAQPVVHTLSLIHI